MACGHVVIISYKVLQVVVAFQGPYFKMGLDMKIYDSLCIYV